MDVQGAMAFIQSKEYAENPIGTDFDLGELMKRLDAGEPESKLLKREEVGPRGLESLKILDDASHRTGQWC